MTPIIVGSDLIELRLFLKKNVPHLFEKCRYLLFSPSYEIETLFRSFGIAPIQKEDSPTDVNEFIRKYIESMDNIAQANPGKYWWSTFLGTKNRIGSPLARILPAFVQFLNFEKSTKRHV